MDRIIFTLVSVHCRYRQILDGEIVVNEVVDYVQRRGETCMIFKVGFEETWNSINGEFLSYMIPNGAFFPLVVED